MSVDIIVAGKTETRLEWKSIKTKDIINPTGDTASISGIMPISSNFPTVDEELLLYLDYGLDTEYQFFGGVIDEIEAIPQDPGFAEVHISATDYTKWLDHTLVSGFYNYFTVGGMVNAILSGDATHPACAPGFGTAWVDADSNWAIFPKSFNWVKVSDALQEIAEESRGIWWVDFNKVVSFRHDKDPVLLKAPLEYIDGTTETRVGGLRWTASTHDLANSFMVKDFFIKGDLYYQPGKTAANWATSYYTIPTTEAGKKYILALDFRPADKTGMVVETDTGAGWYSGYVIDYDSPTSGTPPTEANHVYLNPDNKTLRFADDLPINTKVHTKYYPLYGITFPVPHIDPLSINVFKSRESPSWGGSPPSNAGEYQQLISYSSLEFGGTNPLESLASYISSQKEKYAWPKIEGQFELFWDSEIDADNPQRWRAGQAFDIIWEGFGMYDLKDYFTRLWLGDDLTKQAVSMWVKSVDIEVVNPYTLKYTITFCNVRD